MMLNDLYLRRKELAVMAGLVLAVFWSFSLLSWAKDTEWDVPYNWSYPFLFYTLGMALTSGSFRQASSLRDGVLFLSQPAGTSEKFIARFLWTGLGFVLFFNLFWYAATIPLNLMIRLFLSKSIPVLAVVPGKISTTISIYLLLHATMLVGAVLFRKNHFLLTFAGIAIAWLVISFSTVLYNKGGIVFNFTGVKISGYVYYSEGLRHKVVLADTLIYFGLCMPLMWMAAFRLFREKEI